MNISGLALRPVLAFGFLLLAILASSALAEDKQYLGASSCKGDCHSEIYKTWLESKHAKSFQNLLPGAREKGKKEAKLKINEDYSKDKSCLPCHVTGWNEGGYSMVAPQKELEGVGCESCHGAAGQWNEPHKDKDLPARKRRMKQLGQMDPFGSRSVCAICHEDDTNPYKFRSPPGEKDWEDIKHAGSYHILK